MNITKAFEKAFKTKDAKDWDKIYIAVDVHGTMIHPNYEFDNLPKEFYPDAKEIMVELSNREDIVLILYTCSYPKEIEEYLIYFKENGIKFDYVNSNPEIKSFTGVHGYYEDKFYFNVLLDDKASFEPETDWLEIKSFLQNENF